MAEYEKVTLDISTAAGKFASAMNLEDTMARGMCGIDVVHSAGIVGLKLHIPPRGLTPDRYLKLPPNVARVLGQQLIESANEAERMKADEAQHG